MTRPHSGGGFRRVNPVDIEFRRLDQVDRADIIGLMNNPLAQRQMPLARDTFTEANCDEFVAEKERMWAEHGYGPWAFYADGRFAGWGDLQPEGDDADLGLVLHPRSWGLGKTIFDRITAIAFGEMGLASIIVLLPASRTRIRGLFRLGFEREGELEAYGKWWIRLRLHAPHDLTEDRSAAFRRGAKP